MTGSTRRMVAIALVAALVLGGAITGLVAALTSGDDTVRSGGSSGETESPDEPTDTPTATPTPDQGATTPPRPALASFYSQDIDWQACSDGVDGECGLLTVPVDYRKPAGETIELKLLRAPATDPDLRVGSLVVNPGGPGAPGSETAAQADAYFTGNLRDHFDIVGFDPRGTGESDPIDCLSDADLDDFIAVDPAPDDAAEEQDYLDESQTFWRGCAANSDAIAAHASTQEAAMDMDVLRAALGEGQLDYLGFSYGTRLGATYAELFPTKVGRFVLDGAIDPTLSSLDNSLSQAAGFEVALRAYVQDCVDQGSCILGGSVDEGLQTITDLLDQIDQQPLPASGGRDLAGGNAFYGLILPLYSKDTWPVLTKALEQALNGDGSTMLVLSDLYGSRENGTYSDNSLEAISVINCLDDDFALTPQQVKARMPQFLKASPTFGEVFAWGMTTCASMQASPPYKDLTIKAEGANPIVVLGTTRDPATPYQEAVALADQLASGVLVSRDGDGHTAYNKDNDCIDEAVEDYLIDDTPPTDGLTC